MLRVDPLLPPTDSTTRAERPVAFAAVVGGGVSLFAAVVGLVLIGLKQEVAQDAITALSTIGGALAGAFGGWMARGTVERDRADARP